VSTTTPPLASGETGSAHKLLVLACGALAREIKHLTRLHDLVEVTLECLPASLHNTPRLIAAEVEARLVEASGSFDRVLVGYADCGTVGALDEVCARHGAVRLPGAHCYEFFAGAPNFASLHDDDPGTFYLTDYLVKHFDRIVITGLGLDRHPELLVDYFGNYNRLVYLAQSTDESLVARAEQAAARLGLAFEHHPSGYGELEPVLVNFATSAGRSPATGRP
jgi:hypothetical protein